MSNQSNYLALVRNVNDISRNAKKRGIVHLFTEDEKLNGRIITINKKPLINFGSCSYLGLETDERLKESAINAIKKYGTQFSSSRTYVSCGNYYEFEELINRIFGNHTLLTTSSSLGHQVVMPIVIEPDDAVIFDQQAHVSMQEMSYKLIYNGTHITVLRHNKLSELENKIKGLRDKYKKIWYVADGIYSMYGDLCPVKELEQLLNKYKQLHLYIDDAHGMSWSGQNGSGYTLSQIRLHPRMVMATSLAKGFGSCGGVFIFPNKELYERVKLWGGPNTYSGPQQPGTVGASIASAKIHLSDEIKYLQKKLREKIEFCNYTLNKYKLPVISNSESPIFFIGLGLTRMGYNMVGRIKDEGYYTNIGIYPAVPETCTGIRFTITNHLSFEDIEGLAKKIAYHLPKALKEEDRTMKDISRAFRKIVNLDNKVLQTDNPAPIESGNKLVLNKYASINEIDKEEWDSLFADKGAFNHANMALYEKSFSNNPEEENNWDFDYYIIKNSNNKIILATFFSTPLVKDDMLSPDTVSAEIEKMRTNDPYFLTSKTYMMGTLITNGNHLYLNRNSAHWKRALMMLLDKIWEEQEKNGTKTLFLRDFNETDTEIRDFLCDQGFVKVKLPDNNIVYNAELSDPETFFSSKLHKKKRYYLKKDVLQHTENFKMEISNTFENNVFDFYNLYRNVKENSLALNTFDLPKKLFENISKHKNWEVLKLIKKDENKIASISLCVKSDKCYCAVIIGIDYTIDSSYNIYKQSLYHMIKRGLELKSEKIHLGVTASEAKKKLGASSEEQVGYIQMKDNYNINLIESIKMNIVNSKN